MPVGVNVVVPHKPTRFGLIYASLTCLFRVSECTLTSCQGSMRSRNHPQSSQVRTGARPSCRPCASSLLKKASMGQRRESWLRLPAYQKPCCSNIFQPRKRSSPHAAILLPRRPSAVERLKALALFAATLVKLIHFLVSAIVRRLARNEERPSRAPDARSRRRW